MPPTTSFIALQCFQCSTMQVKQQKKSSNKWTCVVCNEKQSVRKVYAQGSMAKDVRKFVQSFNMSRKFIDEEEKLSVMISDGEEAGGSCSGNGKKRRSDWSEYLDPEEEEGERGADMEGEIVTAMPKEMLKKPKLKNQNQFTRLQSIDRDGTELLKPNFPKRNTTNRPAISFKEAMTMAITVGNEAASITQDGNDSQMVEEEIHPDFM